MEIIGKIALGFLVATIGIPLFITVFGMIIQVMIIVWEGILYGI